MSLNCVRGDTFFFCWYNMWQCRVKVADTGCAAI